MKSDNFAKAKQVNDLVYDVLKGTQHLRSMAEKHLPRFEREDYADYRKRLNRATLTPILQETVSTVVGRIFSNDIQIDSALPLDSVNELNDSFSVVLRDVVTDAVKFGCSYVFVNYVDGLPQFEHIPYASVKKIEEDGLRLKSIAYTKGGKDIEIGRGYVSIDKVSLPIIMHGKVIDFCPVVPFNINAITPSVGSSPYAELAALCIKLWQADSAQDNIVSYLRQPLLLASGISANDGVEVSAGNLLIVPKDADVRYVEHSGNAVAVGFDHIDRIKQDCLLAGAAISSLSKISMTDGQAEEEKTKTTARVLSWCEKIEDCAANALQIAADYVGLKDGGSVSLRENVLNEKSKVSLDDVVNLVQNGILSADEARNHLASLKLI